MKGAIHTSSATEPAVRQSEPRAGLDPPFGGRPTERRSRRGLTIAALAALAVAATAAFLLHARRGGSSSSGPVATVVVTRGDFVRALRLAGVTQAVRSQPIVAPRLAGAQLSTMIVTGMSAAGSSVKIGDVLVEFDRQGQYKDFLDKQASFRDLEDQLAEKSAQQGIDRAKGETALEQAQDALEKARLEASKSEILSRIDAEKAREALAEADATLKQLRQTTLLDRQAAAADLRGLEIQMERAGQVMRHAQANAGKMIIRAPMNGVVVLNSIWLGGRMGEVQVGDEIRPGVPFMRVVDPGQMDVNVAVSQADLRYLRVGQHAVIHLDAYPGLSLPGTLEELAPSGHPGEYSNKVRQFPCRFSIRGADPRLMPDLSAAVDVELDERKDAVLVPDQSVAATATGSYVWLKTGAGFEKRPVKPGPRNDLATVIESGLAPGDVIREAAPENSGAAGPP